MPIVCFATSTPKPLYWYQQSQLIMYENRLYEMSKYSRINLETFGVVLALDPVPLAEMEWEVSLSRTVDGKFFKFFLSAFFDVDGKIRHARFTQSRVERGPYFDQFTAPVLRLQRVVARWAKSFKSRLEARRLALAMAAHSRLGQASGIRVLGLDLLAEIGCLR